MFFAGCNNYFFTAKKTALLRPEKRCFKAKNHHFFTRFSLHLFDPAQKLCYNRLPKYGRAVTGSHWCMPPHQGLYKKG